MNALRRHAHRHAASGCMGVTVNDERGCGCGANHCFCQAWPRGGCVVPELCERPARSRLQKMEWDEMMRLLDFSVSTTQPPATCM